MTGIYGGAAEASAIYAGTAPVTAVYAGDVLIWPTTPTHWAHDDFERASLGASWSTYGQAPRIVTGALKASATAGNGKAAWTTPLPGDDVVVGITIGDVTDAVQKTTLRLGGSLTIDAGDYRSYVCVDMNATTWAIVSRDPAYTTRASGSWSLADGDTVTLRRVGTTVTLARNAVTVRAVSFTQPPLGAGNRYASVDVNNYFSGGVFGQYYYSPTVGEWWADPA